MRNSPNPAWTVRQVAESPSVSPRAAYRTAERGELPAFEVGDARRFRREDVDVRSDRQLWERRGDTTAQDRPAG